MGAEEADVASRLGVIGPMSLESLSPGGLTYGRRLSSILFSSMAG